jgi:hypothetical protein
VKLCEEKLGDGKHTNCFGYPDINSFIKNDMILASPRGKLNPDS